MTPPELRLQPEPDAGCLVFAIAFVVIGLAAQYGGAVLDFFAGALP